MEHVSVHEQIRLESMENRTNQYVAVKVMSFNIHHGADAKGNYDLSRTADVIRRSGAELVGLQEVDRYYSSRSNLEDTIARMSSMLGMRYAYGANLDRVPQEPGLPRSQYGTAVLSKYPIVQQHNCLLTSFGQEQRGLLETLVDVRGIPVYFYTTHLSLHAEHRLTQTEEILSIAERRSGAQIITGDFNARPDSPEIKRMATAFRETFEGQPDALTFDSGKPYAKIDYIWANDQALPGDARQTQVIRSQASDHFPLVSELYLKLA